MSTHGVTELLAEWTDGNQRALDMLMPLVYQRLRQLAAGYLRRERAGCTLQATALVHEAYLRLAGHGNPGCQNRSHFYGIAARLMRQILIDHARRREAAKRAGTRVTFQETANSRDECLSELMALDKALRNLGRVDERKSRVIEFRYFLGLSMEEIASVLNVSAVTIRRELRMAEAWLRKEIVEGAMAHKSEKATLAP